jgi:hypothetical protein
MTRCCTATVGVFLCALCSGIGGSSSKLFAHSVRQQVSNYENSEGLSRSRLKLDLNLNFSHSYEKISGTAYSLSGAQERYAKSDISDDEYSKKIYGSRSRVTNSFALSSTQTWQKLTDTRVVVAGSKDLQITSETAGLGVSHWFWKETLQLAVDVSRTLVKRPVFEVLGEDSDIVSPPPTLSSTGTTLGFKHLTTPTTIVSGGVAHVETNERPPENSYNGGVKQFIPRTKSAVHGDVSRIVNRGRVTSKSSYGEVDAWTADLAFLQTLWKGGLSRLSYRYYQEDETTRVRKDELRRGSDTFGVNVAQDLDDKTLELAAYRYFTNEIREGERVAANVYELGFLARF